MTIPTGHPNVRSAMKSSRAPKALFIYSSYMIYIVPAIYRRGTIRGQPELDTMHARELRWRVSFPCAPARPSARACCHPGPELDRYVRGAGFPRLRWNAGSPLRSLAPGSSSPGTRWRGQRARNPDRPVKAREGRPRCTGRRPVATATPCGESSTATELVGWAPSALQAIR